MSGQLVAHRGGWEVDKAEVLSVVVPEETPSYVPVPYGRFIEEVELHIPRFGFTIQEQEFALARDGQQLFGVIHVTNGSPDKDYGLAIGLRNSYDRSLSVGLVAGHSVFCCDNLAFWGEAAFHRKHTVHVFRDLPDLIYQMLNKVSVVKERQDAEIAQLQRWELARQWENNLLMESVRKGVLPASQIPKVVDKWENPIHPEFEPRTAWSLYNCFTEVMKSRSARNQMEETLRLSRVFREQHNVAHRA